MNQLNPKRKETLIERALSVLFPPDLEPLSLEAEHLGDTVGYQYRLGRKGVENRPGFAVGRVAGEARQKRVFYLGPRTAWE